MSNMSDIDSELADERRSFIREAAIRLACVFEQETEEHMGHSALTPTECWATAAELWDCKPEDC